MDDIFDEIYEFDDLDEFEEITQFTELDSRIANQCIAIYSEDVYIGTGVLLNDSGVFISVGHNFKQNYEHYHGFYDNTSFEISLIYNEYDEDSCDDFCVGKLAGFNTTRGNLLPLSVKNLDPNSILSVCGFKSKKLRITPIKLDIKVSDSILVDQYITKVQFLSKEEWIKRPGRKYTPRAKDDRFPLINIDANLFHGLSGGPIYTQEGIHGVLIGEMFVPSEYIKSVLEKLDY